MLKRVVGLGLLAGLALGFLSSCGDSSDKSGTQPGKGSLLILIGDAPFCDLLSFAPAINDVLLTPEGGGADADLYQTNPLYVRINFAALRDFTTVLGSASLQEATYTHAKLKISSQSMIFYDPTQDPPTKTQSPSFTESTPKVAIEPPLTVAKDKVNVLRVDFDMRRSIEVDQAGDVTGNVTPRLRITQVTATEEQGFGPIDGLFGFVRSVTTTSSNPDFIGSFQLQLLSGSGPVVNVNLPKDTLHGVEELKFLWPGSFVDVDGFLDQSGNLVANVVEVEDIESIQEKKVAFIGYVLAVTRENGILTGFKLFVQQTEPDVSFFIGGDVPVGTVAEVSVLPETVYQFSSRPTNFADLTFDAAGLAVGQQVVVHGKYTAVTDQPIAITADKVYLKLQTIQGSFSSLIRAESDDKTGAFRLGPCCTLVRGTPIYVMTNSQTAFVNVSGLSGLTRQPPLLVKGLPFFQAQESTIHGVSVPAGTLVVLAKQVHQLE